MSLRISGSGPASSSTRGAVKLSGDLAGTADAPTVPGLANKVSTSTPLNQLTPPTSSVSLANVRATNAADPQADQDVATKRYVDTSLANVNLDARYQRISDKGTNGGYPTLDSGGHIPPAELGNGLRPGNRYLRDDGTWEPIEGTAAGLFRGDWATATFYKQDDWYLHGGSPFYATRDHSSVDFTTDAASAALPGSNVAAPDASSSSKGLVKLTGDLAGTADSPTVPGLADKADAVHTHPSTAITDFTEAVQDVAGAAIVAGSNVTVTYNDAAGTITIASTGTGGGGTTDVEVVRDTILSALKTHTVGPISIDPNGTDDANDVITIACTAATVTVDGSPVSTLNVTSAVTASDFGGIDAPASPAAGDMLFYTGTTWDKVAGAKTAGFIPKIQVDGSIQWVADTGGSSGGAGLDLWRSTSDLAVAMKMASPLAAGMYYGPDATLDGSAGGGETSSAPAFAYIDPADFAISGLTPKFRVRQRLATDVAQAATFTAALHPIDTVSGADNAGVRYNLLAGGQVTRRGVGTASTTSNSTAMAPKTPAATVVGDILILTACFAGGSNSTPGFPTGWTVFADQANLGGAVRTVCAWKRATSAEVNAAGVTVAVTGGANGGTNVSNIAAYSGCVSTGSPVDQVQSTFTTSSATINFPSITPTVDGSRVVFVSGYGDDVTTIGTVSGTNPATPSQGYNSTGLAGTSIDASVSLADGLKTDHSATGARTATATGGTVATNVGITFNLMPAVVGATAAASIVAPGTTTPLTALSPEFDTPTAGWYLLAVQTSAALTATGSGSAVHVKAQLEVHWV